MEAHRIPIIAIDGTTASGKGTIAYRLAQHFGFKYLNTGALYRLVAYSAIKQGVPLTDKDRVVEIAKTISAEFEGKQVIVDGIDIWPTISTQEWGQHASIISPIVEVRYAIHQLQRDMIQSPGLVAEGRDMGTHVFTDAHVKLYLDASVEKRAERRHKEEVEKQSGKLLEEIAEELRLRDERDKHPSRGPHQLRPSEDGYIVDTSNLDIAGVLEKCILWCNQKGLRK